MKRSVIRVLDELVNLIVLVIVLILGGYGVYTLWDDRQIYQSADMENYETWRPEEDDDLSFRELQAINPEVIGWLTVYGTKIDYPVLKGKEWNEYLHKNYEGDYSYAGSIFIQPGTSFDDRHLVIYGHNMRVKSMFGSLHDFESEDFYKKHNKIYLYQPGKTIKCTIYSVYDCLDKSATYNTDFSDDGNDNKWVDWLTMTVNNNAYYPIKKKPAEKDHIITLSTCSGKQKGDSYRFVVHSLVTDTVIYEE